MKKLTKLITFCRRLPHATEDIKWGNDLVFSIGAKMFAVFNAETKSTVSFKTTSNMFDSLTKKDDIDPAPYLARYHWVFVKNADALPHDMLEELVRESYEMVKAKLPSKVRAKLE